LTNKVIGEILGTTMNAVELIDQIKALPEAELTQVVNFVNGLEVSESGLSHEWEKEVDRRLEDIKSGRVETVPAEQAHNSLRERLRTHRNAG